LRETLQSLRDKLRVTGHLLEITVGAESYDAPYQSDARKICIEYGANFLENLEAPNLGRNLNNLQKHTKNPWIMYVQDDFELESPLEIGYDISLMEANSEIDMIRYTWRKITPSEYQISEYRHDLYLLNTNCPHLYSDNPHLRRRDWLDRTGPYVTQDNAACENEMRQKANELKLRVLLTKNQSFRHSGIETVMWEKWAKHPKGWAASLLVTPNIASKIPLKYKVNWGLHDYVVKLLREDLPRRILEVGPSMLTILLFQYFSKVPEVKYNFIYRPKEEEFSFIEFLKYLNYPIEQSAIGLRPEYPFTPRGVPFHPKQIMDLLIINEEETPEMSQWIKHHIDESTTIIYSNENFKLSSTPTEILEDPNSPTRNLIRRKKLKIMKDSKREIISERFGKIDFDQIPQKVYELLWEIHDGNEVYRKDPVYTREYLLDRCFSVWKQLKTRGLLEGTKRILEIGPANAIFATLLREVGHFVECVEHPKELGYRKVLHALAHHTHFFLITPEKIVPPNLEPGYDLINATGVQFDMYPDQTRWSTDLWINVIQVWINLLKPKGKIFLARNWETPPGTNERLVRHYKDPNFLKFLDSHPKIDEYLIKEEVLTLSLK
jgi:hypothetical protein